MSKLPRCVMPSASEEELAVVPCPDAGGALRVMIEPGPDGYVRLQEMAYTEGLGWYVQRSIVVPREALALLATELRKADCLIPKPSRRPQDRPPMRLVPAPDAETADAPERQRRGA